MDDDLPLGRPVEPVDHYSPALLRGIDRAEARAALELDGVELPFSGIDVWNAYEVSWLGPRGVPVVAVGTFRVDCHSPRIVESKSLKLYLNSLNLTRFESAKEVEERVARDLSVCAQASVVVSLQPVGDAAPAQDLDGVCIDDLPIGIDGYELDPDRLRAEDDAGETSEALVSHLLRTLCPVTSQPDWASVRVRYRGPRIDRGGLLRYLVSHRTQREFHEACVERIFVDVLRRCAPRSLSVEARFLRRGGLDINPFRSNFEAPGSFARLLRQ